MACRTAVGSAGVTVNQVISLALRQATVWLLVMEVNSGGLPMSQRPLRW